MYDLNKKKDSANNEKRKIAYDFLGPKKLSVLLHNKSYVFLLGGPPGVSFEVMVDRALTNVLFSFW